jgi:hypothetical protein
MSTIDVPAVPTKRKRPIYKRVWFWVLITTAAVIIAVVAGMASAANSALNSKHTIIYRVDPTGPQGAVGQYADITYTTWQAATGKTETVHVGGATLPWSLTVQGHGSLSSYVVTALSMPDDPRNVECTLTIDGKVASSDTGGSTAASCAG